MKCRDCGENMIYVEHMKGVESYACKVVDGVLAIDSSSYSLDETEVFETSLKCPNCGYNENVNLEVDFR